VTSRVCASAKAMVTVDIPVNCSATGPVYLLLAPTHGSTAAQPMHATKFPLDLI
jgi:hypothetical protein